MVVRTQSRTSAAPTSGTTPVSHAITFSLGGKTPKGLILELTSGTALGTAVAPLRLSVGFADGSSQFSIAGMAESGNAASLTDAGFLGDNGSVGQFPLATSEARDAKVRLSSFAADTVNLLWDELPTAAILVKATVYYGDDCEAHAGSFLGDSTIGNSVEVTGVGFAYGHLHVASNQNGASADDSGANFRLYLGLSSHLDGVIREFSESSFERDRPSDLATHAGNVIRDAGSVLSRHSISAGGTLTDSSRLDVASVTSDGFFLETLSANAALGGIFLAVNTRRQKVWCGMPSVSALATSGTGTRNIDTSPKGAVSSLFAIGTRLATANSISDGANESGDFCLGHSDGTTERASVCQSTTAAVTGSTRSAMDSHLLRLLKDDGSDSWVAQFNAGAHSDGFQIQVLTASASDFFAGFLTLSDENIVQPSPVALGVSAPAVTRRHTLVPSAVALGVSAPAVTRRHTLVPSAVALGVSAPAVSRLLTPIPSAVELGISAPAVSRLLTVVPAPALLGVSVPSVVRLVALVPSPALLGISAADVARLLTLLPAPALLALSAPDVDVVIAQTIRPTPVHLGISAPAVSRLVVLGPSPALLGISAPAVDRLQTLLPSPTLVGISAPAVSRLLALTPTPALLGLLVAPPSLVFENAVQPAPVGLGLQVALVAVLRNLAPDPVGLLLLAADVDVLTLIQPDAVELLLLVPEPDLGRVEIQLRLQALLERSVELEVHPGRSVVLEALVARALTLAGPLE